MVTQRTFPGGGGGETFIRRCKAITYEHTATSRIAIMTNAHIVSTDVGTVNGYETEHTVMYSEIILPGGKEVILVGNLDLWHDDEGVKWECGTIGMTGWNRKFRVSPRRYIEGQQHIMRQIFDEKTGLTLMASNEWLAS